MTLWRLPIEGEQEAAESIVMAEHMRSRKKSARMTYRVNQGNEKECDGLQKMKLHPEEGRQCNINTENGIPEKHDVPVEKEQADSVGSNAKDSRGYANALNALGMRADCPCRQRKSVGMSMESRRRERGISKHTCADKSKKVVRMPAECCQQSGKVAGDAGRREEPMATLNELVELPAMTARQVHAYVLEACVSLQATRTVEDGSSHHVNGCGNCTNGPSVHTDMHSVANDTETAENKAENVRMHPVKLRT